MKNVQLIAKYLAVEFFKSKGEENNRKYQSELMEIYKAYDDVRSKFFNDEKKIAQLTKIILSQERINLELRTFIQECLNEIFYKVELREPEIYEQILTNLPTNV